MAEYKLSQTCRMYLDDSPDEKNRAYTMLVDLINHITSEKPDNPNWIPPNLLEKVN